MRSFPALLAAAALFLAAPRAYAAPGSPRAAHTTTLLATGDVLIAGGQSGAGAAGRLKTAELLLSSNGTNYADTANTMSVERASATATNLPNGLVLIAGGIDASNTVRNDVEVYDPATRTFAAPLLASSTRGGIR